MNYRYSGFGKMVKGFCAHRLERSMLRLYEAAGNPYNNERIRQFLSAERLR